MSKYALVHWTNSNNTSIVQGSLIDKELVDNSVKIGKIPAALLGKKEPANGWSKHDGRVICMHEKVSFLKAKEAEFLSEDCSDDEEPLALAAGRGHRQPKRKVFPGESSDSSDEDKADPSKAAKAKKLTQTKAQQNTAESIIEKLKRRHEESLTTEQKCSDCAKIKQELQHLRAENEALRKGLPDAVNKLHSVIFNVQSAVRVASSSSGKLLSSPPQSAPRSTVFSSPSTPRSSNASPVVEVEGESTEVELGTGVVIPPDVWRNCSKENYKRLTRDLMCAIFFLDEMSSCSVFGKRGRGAIEDVRPPLPRNKVMAIIGFVKKHFPAMASTQISQTMGYKLKDVRASTSK